jgi:glucuronosyltransferase
MLVIKIIAAVFLGSCQGANILGIFGIPYYSHQAFERGVMMELAERKHNLTIFTTHLFSHDYENVKLMHFNESSKINRESVNQLSYSKGNIIAQAYNELKFYYKLFDQQLGQSEMQDLIKNGKKNDFDLVILECYFFCPTMALAEIFDCPIIVLTAIEGCSPLIDLLGGETNPVLHPDKTFFPAVHGKLTLFERIHAFGVYVGFHLVYRHIIGTINYFLLSRHFPRFTSMQEKIEDRIALVFQNSLTTVKPVLPNMVDLHSMHVYPPKTLPEGEMKNFLDASQNGVIFMSLGSFARSKDLDSRVIDTLTKTFASLRYDVLWKFEDHLHNKSNNVMVANWLPQSDILAHQNLKLFITHGGLMSTQEAIDREVPMIVFPITYDQPANANELVEKGVACKMNLYTLAEETLREAINEMMKPRYKSNIRELKRRLNDQPMTSREKAIWHTEFVIRNKGAKHLAYPVRKVPFYQRHHYDIILLISITTYLTFKAMESIWNRFSQPRSMKRLVAKKND